MVKSTSYHIVYTSGGIVALLGILCMATWLSQHGTLLQLNADFIPMSFNAALCHFLSGIALVTSLYNKRVSLLSAMLSSFLAGLVGWQYLTGTTSGIDNFFVIHDFTSASSFPGRLAPNTVLSFLIFTSALMSWHLIEQKNKRLIVLMILGLTALIFSVAAVMGHILGIEAAYKWGAMNRMAPLTAVAFFILSLGLIGLLYTDKEGVAGRTAVLLPLLVTLVGLTISLFCIQALIVEKDLNSSSDLDIGLIGSVLTVGIVLPLLTGAALWQRENLKAYSRQLSIKEQQLQRTVAAAQVGLWDWDLQSNTLIWAGSSYKIYAAIDNASLPTLEEDVLRLIQENDRDGVRKRVLESIERGEGFIVDYRTRRLDGQEIWVQSRGNVVELKDGNPIRLSGTLMDISAAKMAEIELRRSNEELEQFAYIASHDLKAPLRGIDNLAKWVVEDTAGILPHDAEKKLELLRGRVARLEALLEDILTYSRAGRMLEDSISLSVADIVYEVAQTHLPSGFEIVKGNLPNIVSPRTPLIQIFGNILSNAVKHHDKASGRIFVTAKDAGNFYRFSVCDDGPGIPPEFHDRAFQMFQTLQPRDKIDGSGIGMAIIKKLVEWRGGSVWIEANPGGRGTCINFLWPKFTG